MRGYHFVGDTLRDGRPVPADGEWLMHVGRIIPCKSGLHASEHPFDALRYAPGAILCRVELEEDLVSHSRPIDKWVGRRRRIVARIDADYLLRRFAADQALHVAHLWEMPEIVRNYLTTLDKRKRAASMAASEAASWMVSAEASLEARAEFTRRVEQAFAEQEKP